MTAQQWKLCLGLALSLSGGLWAGSVRTGSESEVLQPGGLSKVRIQHIVGRGTQQVLFGQEIQGDFEHFPVLLHRGPGRWKILRLEEHSQMGWVHAGSLPGGGGLAVLDMDVESPGWKLEVFRWTPESQSWEHSGSLEKPSYLASFEAVRSPGNGLVEVDILLEEGLTENALPGRYRASSRDEGRTWSSFSLAR